VAQVLGCGSGFPYYGFSVTWSAPIGKSYTLRIRLGRQMREIALSERR
jgi:hypothetical protein